MKEYGVIPVIYVYAIQNASPGSIRKILTKLKKHKNLFSFLKKLSTKELYLFTKKLDECDQEPITEFSNDLYDGSKEFMKMKRILMDSKSKILIKGLKHIINKLLQLNFSKYFNYNKI